MFRARTAAIAEKSGTAHHPRIDVPIANENASSAVRRAKRI
jgi:hypothetical protein